MYQDAIKIIKESEGCYLHPYLCPAGVPTIGYGSTYYETGRKVSMTDSAITVTYAEKLLLRDVGIAAKSITKSLTVSINNNQLQALIDFVYNLGITKFKGSTLFKMINKNPDDPVIANEFNKWVYAGGRKLAGLVTRRKKDVDLYFRVI